jgi:hypothetical protein
MNGGCTALGITLSRNGFYNKTLRAWSRWHAAQAVSLHPNSKQVGNQKEFYNLI